MQTGTLGCVIEVTADGEEVWRWLNPIIKIHAEGVAFARQGESRLAGSFSLFRVLKYSAEYPALSTRRDELAAARMDARYLEA